MKKKEFFHISQIKRRYDKQTGKFIINIAYQTAAPKPTNRTTKVAETFGLGLDQTQKYIIYDNIELKIGPKDIVYITGESGSGKTILLKTLEKDIRKYTNLQCINIAEIKPPTKKPIIETIGKTFKEGLEILSRVGLNDAFLFLRTYKQLSDGQKYRYKIAKIIESQTQFWVMDEFAATLDRDTAKIVAYNLQKLARQQGKAVIAATTHTDLFEDLNPSVHIHKNLGKEITIKYYPNTPARECSIIKEISIQKGTAADYKRLSPFHYRSTHLPSPRKIFTLKRGEETCGVIVYSHPPPTMFGRNKVWKGSISQLKKEISTITRVVIHPKYRTIGLGTKLVKETLPLAETPNVETLAVMAKYNPFFERAGMKKVTETKPNEKVMRTIEKLENLRLSPTMLGNTTYTKNKIGKIGQNKIAKILKELSEKDATARKRLLSLQGAFPKHQEFIDKIKKANKEEMAKALKRLSFLTQTKVYLFWKREKEL
jgi:ABC-type ATPase with predicted acetyltransferase domain